jgi:hypothetical protein
MRPAIATGTFAILLLSLGAAEAGSEAPSSPAIICESDPRFADFDFWLGQWRVTTRHSGALAGTNSISKVEAGCAVQESWSSARGGSGRSLNWYNPATSKWRQVWVAAPGYVIDIEGGLRDGSMVLEGTITDFNDRVPHPFRGTWTPQDDGTVRQFFEQYAEEEEAWKPWFDGLYTRIDTTAN